MKYIIVLLSVLAWSSATPKGAKPKLPTRVSPRIIGGAEAVPHSIPYQVFLEVYGTTQGWYCSGTLISRNFVMTAGHCGRDTVEAHITLGAHRVFEYEDTQVKIISTEVIVHENFSDVGMPTNDISLMKLPYTIDLTDAIQVVSLPRYSDVGNIFRNYHANVSGWGLTATPDNNGKMSEVLKVLPAGIQSNAVCEEWMGPVPDSILCTFSEQFTYICNGDSGGPLSYNGTQLGVASFGHANCAHSYPVGYMRLTSFLDWLAENSDAEILD